MSASAVSPLRLAAPALAAALAGLLLAVPAPAESPAPESPFQRPVAERTLAFRQSLRVLKFTTLKSFADLKPRDCVLVMLGDTRRLTEVPGGLQQFLAEGGAALIASDKPMTEAAKAQLRQATGVTITGYTWVRPPNLQVCYRRISYCPYMQCDDVRFMRHPLHPDRRLTVATNMPSLLQPPPGGPPPGISYIAALPDHASFEVPESEHVVGELPNLFGVAGDVGRGRVLVLADHSIFIDEMMKPTDNQNVEFTGNCLTYLRGEQNERKKVLFVDDGVIADEPRPPLLPKANALLNEAAERLNQFEQDDKFNEAFADALSWVAGALRTTVARMLFITATLALLVYGCYRLGVAARVRHEPGVPALAQAARAQGPAGSLIEQRHDGVLDAQNIWEAGRQLARDAFEAAGVAPPVPYREPVVTLKDSWWWQRARARARVLRLWRLAFLNKPVPLPPYAALSLAAELEELKAALQVGTIRLS